MKKQDWEKEFDTWVADLGGGDDLYWTLTDKEMDQLKSWISQKKKEWERETLVKIKDISAKSYLGDGLYNWPLFEKLFNKFFKSNR